MHIGHATGVTGPHKEHLIAGLGVGYGGRNVIESLGAQLSGITQACAGQYIADEVAAIKESDGTSATSHIGIA